MAGEAIVGAAISSIIGGAFAKADAKKQRDLEEELAKLSLDQQKEIAIHLQDVQGELEKQKYVYQYLAVKNNQEVLGKIQSKRYTSYIVLGFGIAFLATVVILLSKKKHE